MIAPAAAGGGKTMDRSRARCLAPYGVAMVALVAVALVSSSGCVPQILATGIYLWEGGNVAPAECDALKGHRVVVVCRPPSSNEYRHAGAAQRISQGVSELLVKNVKGIDVVNPREVDNWLDESDWGDFSELAKAVHAELVVHVELNDFELFKGKTLYQGNANVTVSVYDMDNRGKLVWSRDLGEILYPLNSAIPAQDKPVQQFEREFVGVVAGAIARNFYRHDPHEAFALDATATR
jgi:hypothetical protein